MIVECPQCTYKKNVDASLIPELGGFAICPKCKVRFWFEPELNFIWEREKKTYDSGSREVPPIADTVMDKCTKCGKSNKIYLHLNKSGATDFKNSHLWTRETVVCEDCIKEILWKSVKEKIDDYLFDLCGSR